MTSIVSIGLGFLWVFLYVYTWKTSSDLRKEINEIQETLAKEPESSPRDSRRTLTENEKYSLRLRNGK